MYIFTVGRPLFANQSSGNVTRPNWWPLSFCHLIYSTINPKLFPPSTKRKRHFPYNTVGATEIAIRLTRICLIRNKRNGQNDDEQDDWLSSRHSGSGRSIPNLTATPAFPMPVIECVRAGRVTEVCMKKKCGTDVRDQELSRGRCFCKCVALRHYIKHRVTLHCVFFFFCGVTT